MSKRDDKNDAVRRNPIARALRSPHLRRKVEKLSKGRGSYVRVKTVRLEGDPWQESGEVNHFVMYSRDRRYSMNYQLSILTEKPG